MVAEVKTKIDSIDDFDFFIKYLGKSKFKCKVNSATDMGCNP